MVHFYLALVRILSDIAEGDFDRCLKKKQYNVNWDKNRQLPLYAKSLQNTKIYFTIDFFIYFLSFQATIQFYSMKLSQMKHLGSL